ncbi:MAG TPA: hypothetical protein VMX75_05675 [Spirochaetia bacterium]|nr:hypothetical protein [Spirochaetia bacterium]
MHYRKRKYLDILKVEINDLLEDIGDLVEDYRRRRSKSEITEYVLRENVAVLHSEVGGINILLKILDAIHIDKYVGLDDMVEDIERKMCDRIKSSDLAGALYPMIKRKLEKVKLYVEEVQNMDFSG